MTGSFRAKDSWPLGSRCNSAAECEKINENHQKIPGSSLADWTKPARKQQKMNISSTSTILASLKWRYDTRFNDTEHNNTQSMEGVSRSWLCWILCSTNSLLPKVSLLISFSDFIKKWFKWILLFSYSQTYFWSMFMPHGFASMFRGRRLGYRCWEV
jgi:hypothetical protein